MSSIDPIFREFSQKYYGTTDAAAQNVLWGEFLQKGLVPVGATDAQKQAAYMQFLAAKVEDAFVAEAANMISPSEEGARRIMFEAFNLVLKMLRALQTCMAAQSKLSTFYAEWQDRYTRMMAHTPIYGPESDPLIHAKEEDFGQTSLGYGNIVVRDILSSLMEKMKALSGSSETVSYIMPVSVYDAANQTFSEFGGSTSLGVYQFNLTRTKSGNVATYVLDLKVTLFGEQPRRATFLTGQSSGAVPVGTKEEEKVMDQILSQMTTAWKNTQAVNNPDRFNTSTNSTELELRQAVKYIWTRQITAKALYTELPATSMYYIGFQGPARPPFVSTGTGPLAWPEMFKDLPADEGDKTTNKDKKTSAASYRSELNSKLQIFLETARSWKTRASDASKRLDTLIAQVKESIQSQSTFLSAITESLRGLISAIYR